MKSLRELTTQNSPSCCDSRCLNLSKQLPALKHLNKIQVTNTECQFAFNLVADAFIEGKGVLENQIEELSFKICGLDNEAVQLLAQVLCRCRKLKTLLFEGNKFDERSIPDMTKIIKHVKALRSLSIRSHFALQATGHEMIMRVLSDPSTKSFAHVKELYFDRISIQAILSLHQFFQERNYEWLEALKFRIWPVSCQEKLNVTKVVSNLIS